MKPLLFLLLALLSRPALAQRFRIGGEEFMDTTRRQNPACPPVGYARYYQVEGKYPRSSDTLLREARAFLQQQPGSPFAGSGYVTFRFVVDCQGRRLPQVQVLQTDGAYQPTHFAPALVEALYGFLQTLTEWNVAKATQPTSYVAYLTFKLQDGKVVAVAP